MIVPGITVPSIQATPQYQSEAVSGVPTETSVFSRIPYRAVPSTVSPRETYNDSRSAANYSRNGAVTIADGSSQSASTSTTKINFSAPFMTQWMAQQASSNDNNQALTAWMNVSHSALSPDVMEEYAQVKYLPSNAGRPQPKPKGTEAILEQEKRGDPISFTPSKSLDPTSTKIVTAQAGSTDNVVEQSDQLQLALDQVQQTGEIKQAAAAGATFQTKNAESLPRPPGEFQKETSPSLNNKQIRYNTSLLRDTGYDAYSATFSRNLLNDDQGSYEPLRLTA